jgi:tetratricopeptide (TPR) repeat protein
MRDRGEEARQLVARALEKKPDDMVLKLLELSTRTDLTDEQRRQMRESVIRAEPNEYRRATMLAEMYYSEGSLEQVLPLLDRAEQLLLDQTTFVLDGRTSEMREHRAILSRKMLVAARLDNQEALRSAVDAATKHDVDGAGGKTFLGQYHMYREEADLAIRAFTDAITRQPTDSMALSYLGRCYQHVGRTADARTCFERALQSNPNEYLAHKGLSQLASLDEDRETAEKHLDQCERLSRTMAAYRDDAWMLTELRARAERNDPKTAITRREAELAKSPDDKDNIRRLAMLCEHVEQMDKAESYFRKLMELAPGDRTPIVALSNFFHRRERYDDALKLLEGYVRTIETPHDRANAMITVAAHHFQIGDSANVERVLLEAADLAQTFDVTRSLADYYLRQEMPRRALTWFDRAVDLAREEGSPRLADTMLSRISCLLHRRVADVATGKTRIEEFRREFPKHPDGLYWQAELQAGYGQIAEAIELLTEYIGNRPDNVVALYQRALRYVAMGQIAQAIKDLETIKTLQPAALDLQPRILLARIYEQTDRHDLALREREQMVEDVPNSQSAVAELVHAYVRREWYGDAEKLLTRVLNTVGASSPQMYMLRGEVAAKLGDVPRALADYRQGVAAAGMSAQSVMDFMGLCLRLERYEEGIRFYQEVRPKGAPESALAARYAVLLAKAGREDDAVDELRRGMAAAVLEGSASVRVIHGAVENAFPQTEDAIVRFANRPAADSVLNESNDRVLVGLLIRAGRSDEAHAKLEGLLRKATDDRLRADLVREKAMLYQMTKQYEPARQAYEEALKYDAENPLILNNLAYLLSDQLGQPQLALPYGEKAAELSDNAAVLDTLGWIQVRLGRCREAVAVLSRAVRTDPNLAILWYHLGEAYRQCAEFTVANNVLRTGMGVARLDEDPQLVDLIDSSLRRVARNDSTP